MNGTYAGRGVAIFKYTGGGTIAKYVANRGIPVLDIGVPVLSMHAPFEVIHKNDLYMAYRAFSLFNNAQ